MLKSIPKESIPKFMNSLFHQMSLFMLNAHLCCRYLEGELKPFLIINLSGNHKDGLILTLMDETTFDLSEFYSNVKVSMLTMRKETWHIIQKEIVKILQKLPLNDIAYQDLLSVLQSSSIFIEIGEDFSNSSPQLYQNLIKLLS